jgi:hypothetical protein
VDLVEPAYSQIRPEFIGLHYGEDPLVDCHVLRALDLNPIVQEGSDLSESILSRRKSHDSIIAGTAGLVPSASAAYRLDLPTGLSRCGLGMLAAGAGRPVYDASGRAFDWPTSIR